MNRVKSASSIETGKPEEALETQRPQTPPTPLPSVQLPSYPPVESHDDQASSRRPHTGFFPAKRQARVLGRAGSRMLPHDVSPREDNTKRIQQVFEEIRHCVLICRGLVCQSTVGANIQ
jgi:hypothetical protein